MGILNKMYTSVKAFFNKIANSIYKRDPVAVYQLRIDEATDKIRKGQECLAGFKGHVNRLERQLTEDEKQVSLNQGRRDIALKTNNMAKAQDCDLALQKAEKSRDETKAQLDSFNKQYQQQVGTIKANRDAIIKAQEDCKTLGLKLKMSEANKAAAKMASDFSDTVGNPLSDVGNIRSEIENQIDSNNAVAEVNSDLGIGTPPVDEDKEYAEMQVTDRLTARMAELGIKHDVALPPAEDSNLPMITDHSVVAKVVR